MTAPSHTSRRKPARPQRTGRRAWRVLAGTFRFLGQVLQGVIATTVLLALVAGLPWALWHYVGWPLPDHIPTWDEVQATLLAPMTPQFLLDVLACLLWPLWARFTFDVLAAVPEAVRAAPRPHLARTARRGPLHAAAGVLVSAILLSIVSSRTSTPAMSMSTVLTRSAVADPVPAGSVPHTTGERPGIVPAALHTHVDLQSAGAPTETVRPPEHGVYDSLWRVAERRLGDGNRWAEIWALNKGTKQIDGRVFTNPNLIHPFWELRIPAVITENAPESPVDAQPAPSEPSPPQPPRHDPDDEQAPPPQIPTRQEPTATDTAQPPAEDATTISTSTGAFVGIGLAALITVALITVRLRRRRCYRPGRPEPDDPTRAPIVRALRIAHDSFTLAQTDDSRPTSPAVHSVDRLAELDTRDRARDTARTVLLDPDETALGVHDGHSVALNLAHSKGLGLIGPGAHAAACALIVTALARALSDDRDTRVIVPAADARTLLGADLPAHTPARLRIVDDLNTALDTAEAELLSRIRQLEDSEADSSPERHVAPAAPLVLVASPTPDSEGRIQAIVDNGSAVGLAGILLGQWRPGGTVRVRDDGTVGAASAGLADHLTGMRLFAIPGADATDLLALLRDADPGHEHTSVTAEPGRAPDVKPGLTASTAPAEEMPDTTTETPYDFVRAEAAQSQRDIAPTPSPPAGRVVIDSPARSSTAAEQQTSLDQPDTRLVTPAQAPRPQAPGEDAHEHTTEHPAEPVDCPTDEGSSAPHASTTIDTAPEPTDAVLHLEVLGRLHLRRTEPDRTDDIIEAFAPRQREILIYLAFHPNGVRKETLTADIWPDAPPDRPFNTFHATLSQLRGALRKATANAIVNIVINDDGHYGLDRSLVTVDLWQMQHALTARRQAPSLPERVAALRQVATLYRGDLAEGLTADWIEPPREALRRDVLDALSALIRAVGDGDPEQMLALLEQARSLDPYNEAIYRDLMRVQARLGQYDSIPRTLRLLTTSLAELDQQPARDTIGLAEVLRRPRPAYRRDRPAR